MVKIITKLHYYNIYVLFSVLTLKNKQIEFGMKKWARKFFCCGSKSIPVDDETTVASRQPIPNPPRNSLPTESNIFYIFVKY
jgi:hypothetical protein